MTSFVRFKTLSLKVADEIASQAIHTAQVNGFNPIAVCVMDSTGFPIVTKRMDFCPPRVFSSMAEHKANTSISLQTSTRAYGEKYLSAKSTPDQFMRLGSQIASQKGQVIAFPGGIVIRCVEEGSILGSVGVSGASGNEDEYCALEGVRLSSIASEVVTEPTEHSCTTIKAPA
jgi:uncharacterized protein GlcG (DUF336 family)